MENRIQVEMINGLAVKIANLEVQVAALTAENNMLLGELQGASNEDVEGVGVYESSE
ncbi:MAG: hypothetical protein FWE07_02245 [Turicibacter sp.]|nr:hypothetical protein [Turicibacter sp.]